METATVKKQSNRAIQRTHATYKKKSEISEALNIIRPYLNESTYKFLSHFLHTSGSGVTQAKNIVICEKVGISERSYYKTVKPEIETTFSQSLIITVDAPMKMDKKRKKKVKASPFKSLTPLSVIKHLVKQKEQEEQEELNDFWDEIEAINAVESAVESAVECAVESIPSIPCESKGEGDFSQQQNKSFREKHLENIKTLNNKSILKDDSFSSPPKKYFLKKEIKAILRNAELDELTEEQKEIYGNKIQQFAYDYRLKINDISEMALNTCMDVICHSNIFDFGGYVYTSLENRFLDDLLIQNGVDVQNLAEDREFKQLDNLRDQMRIAYFEGATAVMELASTIEMKPKKKSRSKYSKEPIRTEILPEWFDEDTEQRYGDAEGNEKTEVTEEEMIELQALLNELSSGQAQAQR